MYEDKQISRRLLSAGLFRTAYGLDASRGDAETVFELFVFCAVALERLGIEPESVLYEMQSTDFDRAGWIMDRINAEIVEARQDLPDCLLLMSGLHGLLALQFSNVERHEKRRFLKDLASLT